MWKLHSIRKHANEHELRLMNTVEVLFFVNSC